MTQKSENINKFWKEFHKAVVDSGVAEAMQSGMSTGRRNLSLHLGKAAAVTLKY